MGKSSLFLWERKVHGLTWACTNQISGCGCRNSSERRLASTSLAELPLGCSIRRSLRHTLERNLWPVTLIFLVLISGSYGRYSFTTSRAMEARAKQLAGEVFDRLANHAALNHQEPGSYPDQGISMAQLRDDVLRNEFSTRRRQQLWTRVQKKVEHNANVRAAVRENHSGDVARMWEWVGPVQMLEDARSSSRRESGQYRYPAVENTPLNRASRENLQVSKYDEGHPIY
jgi:hypothetical protein